MNSELISDLEQFGIRPELVQAGNNQLGSDMAMPCFALAKELGQSPQAIAEDIAAKIEHQSVAKAEAVAGYVNVWLSDKMLTSRASSATEVEQSFSGQTVVCEYSDPNPFKVLHAGHLYTSIVGDAIANMYQVAGAKVARVNFGGDVGMHVAKAIWGILSADNDLVDLQGSGATLNECIEYIAQSYVAGNSSYENDAQAKVDINIINKVIYAIHSGKNDTDYSSKTGLNINAEKLEKNYWLGRKLSYEYFDAFYASIGTKFDKYYPESETAPTGLATVTEQLEKGVYQESNGAVVFVGEPHGLHTRVFINSEGLPTYEAKDVGLAIEKWADYKFDKSIIITGDDIIEYMKVVLKSIEQYSPDLVARTTHITHGMVKLAGGVKMSSRLGNFLKAVDVLDAAKEQSGADSGNSSMSTVLAAVKYSFLNHTIGGDIHFDPKESVSTKGNSGPYLQYAHARAKSIAAKAQVAPVAPDQLDEQERVLVRKIAQYGQAVSEAIDGLSPSKVCTYLYELTQVFNRFYESTKVVGSDREAERLYILAAYTNVLSHGLGLLGIEAPDSM